ncbi:uncharacterized protein ACNLHF_003102 [Anomaloglossus baeobatrachus]|uniref:uncharacterized protein LOC142256425 n=1 Tax=Anomaloglossus baeobatrachus TaxID=238106 RepID=UPI003F4F4E42
MKNLVALLCLISALVGSAVSSKCYYGFSPNSTTCNVSEIECLGDRCMTASQYSYNNGRVFNSIMKGCANETMCGAVGSASVGLLEYRFHMNCCNWSLCNTDGYNLPAEDPTPNNATCPSAYCVGNMDECKSDEVMNCIGSMDRCFEFRTDAKDPGGREFKLSLKGCINAVACKFNFDCAIGVAELKQKLVKCYPSHHKRDLNEETD